MSQPGLILEQQQAIREEYRKQAASWGTFEIDDDLRWAVEQITAFAIVQCTWMLLLARDCSAEPWHTRCRASLPLISRRR